VTNGPSSAGGLVSLWPSQCPQPHPTSSHTCNSPLSSSGGPEAKELSCWPQGLALTQLFYCQRPNFWKNKIRPKIHFQSAVDHTHTHTHTHTHDAQIQVHISPTRSPTFSDSGVYNQKLVSFPGELTRHQAISTFHFWQVADFSMTYRVLCNHRDHEKILYSQKQVIPKFLPLG
jgi:hypothetical protein